MERKGLKVDAWSSSLLGRQLWDGASVDPPDNYSQKINIINPRSLNM